MGTQKKLKNTARENLHFKFIILPFAS